MFSIRRLNLNILFFIFRSTPAYLVKSSKSVLTNSTSKGGFGGGGGVIGHADPGGPVGVYSF